MVKRAAWVVAAFLVAAAALYAWPVRPFLLGMRQVRAIADGRSIATFLEVYRAQHGTYPTHLAAALPEKWRSIRDPWGNRWVYITDGSAFLLLSFGKDGRPDRTDYRLPAGNGQAAYHRICGQWDRDQIISNLGVHQGRGK